MKLSDLNPYVRYASSGPFSPLPETVRTYDSRLFYLSRGSASITLETKAHPLSPGALVILPPHLPYRIEAEAGAEMILLNFDHTWDFCEIKTSMHPVLLTEAFTPPPGMLPPLYEDGTPLSAPQILEGMQELEAPLHALVEEIGLRRVGWEEKAAAILKGILIDCLRAAPMGGSARSATQKLLFWLREHCCENPSADAVSARFGYHPVHLNRLLQKATGMSLHQYILHCRLEESKRQLAFTAKTVEEIAIATGFGYVSSFSASFRSRTGMTPGAYRKQYRGLI